MGKFKNFNKSSKYKQFLEKFDKPKAFIYENQF